MVARFGRPVNIFWRYTPLLSTATFTFRHYVSPAQVLSKPKQRLSRGLTSLASPPNSPDYVPYAVRAAGQHFREQVNLKETLFLKENYLYLRQLLLAWEGGSDINLLQKVLPSPNEVFRDAMLLLSMYPSQENAMLHISLFNDITPVFRVPRAFEPPLQFTASILEQYLNTEDLNGVSKAFDHFCYLREGYPDGLEAFDMARVETWMDHLMKAGSKGHADLLKSWVPKLYHSCGIQPKQLYQQYVIKAYLTADLPADAWDWLVRTRILSLRRASLEQANPSWISKLKASFGSSTSTPTHSPFPLNAAPWSKPETEDYDIFLNYFSKRGELDAAKLIMVQMLEEVDDAAPTSRSWHLLLTCVLGHPGCDTSEVQEVLEGMAQHGVPFSLEFLGVVSGRGPIEAWIPKHIIRILRAATDSTSASASRLPTHPLCVDVFPEVAPIGHAPLSQETPQELSSELGDLVVEAPLGQSVDESRDVFQDDVKGAEEKHLKQIIVESQLDTSFDSGHETLNDIMTAVSEKNLSRALTCYEALPQMGVDFQVAYSLISLLCSSPQPSMDNVIKAVNIYDDLLRTYDHHSNTSVDANQSFEIARRAGCSRILHVLIPVLTRPLDQYDRHTGFDEHGASQIIDKLLSGIKTWNIRLSPHLIGPIVRFKFRCAVNHKEALNCYTSLMSDLFTDEKAMLIPPAECHNILSTFARLSYPAWPAAPASLWLSLLSDLNSRGYRTAEHDYTIYLKVISDWKRTKIKSTWKLMRQESYEVKLSRRMAQSTRAIHQHVLIDPHINPNAHLFNALINTYQYLGEFERALEIFNTSWMLSRFDAATPSIMFDACGNAGQDTTASLIWSMLVKKGWKFNKATLDAWIECLCRLGYVNLACNFVCHFMGKKKSGFLTTGDTRPDERTCSIVLKLSWTVGQNLAVKERIKRHLPKIWQSLSLRSVSSS